VYESDIRNKGREKETKTHTQKSNTQMCMSQTLETKVVKKKQKHTHKKSNTQMCMSQTLETKVLNLKLSRLSFQRPTLKIQSYWKLLSGF
jgi:hypothetical protein